MFWQLTIYNNSPLFIWKTKSISVFSSSPLFYHTVVTCQTPCCPVLTYYKYTFCGGWWYFLLYYCKLLLCSTSCSFLTTKSYRLSTKLCTVGSFSYGLCKGGVDKFKDLWTHLSLNYFFILLCFAFNMPSSQHLMWLCALSFKCLKFYWLLHF